MDVSFFKKYFLMMVFLIWCFITCSAQKTPYQLIEEHRAWMKEYYPKPNSLSQSDILKEAAFAIEYGLQEPQVVELLKEVGKRIPEVDEFLSYMSFHKIDYKFSRKIGALKALYLYAKKNYEEKNPTTGWCRYLWLLNLGNIEDVYNLFQQAVIEQDDIAKNTENTENKALSCLFHLGRFEVSEWDNFINTVDLYEDVMNTECEVLKLFPLNDSVYTHTKAYLYMTLAKMKSNFSSIKEAEFMYTVSKIPNTVLNLRSKNGVLTDADFLFAKAEEIYSHVYLESHPEMLDFYYTWLNAKFSYCPIENSFAGSMKKLLEYGKLYYPSNCVEHTVLECNNWEVQVRTGEKIEDAFMWKNHLNQLKQYFGEDNFYYIQTVLNMGLIVSLCHPTDTNEVCQYFERIVEKMYGNDNLKSAFLQYCFYSSIKDIIPNYYSTKITKILDVYLCKHSVNILSFTFGRRLVNDLYNSSQDLYNATKIQKTVTSDVCQKYGDKHYVYFKEKEMELMLLGKRDPSEARIQYPKFIEDMKKSGIDYTTALSDYAYLESNNYNYSISSKLFRQAFDESVDKGNTFFRAYFLLSQLTDLSLMGENESKLDSIYQQAYQMMKTCTDSLSFVPECSELAAYYLESKGKFQETLEILNWGIDFCNILNIGFSESYIRLITWRYHVYIDCLNDFNTAYKLMNEDYNWFEKQNFSYYNIAMLDFLWECYSLTIRYDKENMAKQYKHLMKIQEITANLSIQNNNDPMFLSKYGTDFVGNLLSFLITFKKYIDDIPNYNLSQKQMEKVKTSIDIMGKSIDVVEIYLKDLLRIFHESIPNYQQNANYFNLLSSFAIYYSHVKLNVNEANKFYSEYLLLTKNKASHNYFDEIQSYGDFCLTNKQNTKAIELYSEAQKLIENGLVVSKESNLYLNKRLCNYYIKQKQYDEAMIYAEKTYNCIKAILDNNFLLMTEKEQNSFMSHFQDPAGSMLESFGGMSNRISMASKVYNAILYRTGLQLRSIKKMQKAILLSKDNTIRQLTDSLRQLQTVSKSMNMDWFSQKQEDYNKSAIKYGNLQDKINNLEREIIERAKPYLTNISHDVSWQEVRSCLHEGEVAIEFICAHPYFMALVIKPNYDTPIPVPLVKEDTFISQLKSLGKVSTANMARQIYNEKKIDLYYFLWHPLEKELQGVNKIYYSVQGILSSIAFNAISTPDSKYLIDKYELCPLTSTAELLKINKKTKPTSALLIGNIYYSEIQKDLVNNGEIEMARGGENFAIDDFENRGATNFHFNYLPYVKSEISELKKCFKGTLCTVEEGMNATETIFRKRILQVPSVIHFATHGFFVADDITALRIPFFKRYQQAAGSSMQRAGIALSGAEDSWVGNIELPEDKDGILTANEVSQLNLEGTQLLVLSACETALGNYSFEGVYGLPRGFKQAGVESLIVSLWSVNDRSTALLMKSFYSYWLSGRNKQEAFRYAVNEVRKVYPQPYYWAPFILLDAKE